MTLHLIDDRLIVTPNGPDGLIVDAGPIRRNEFDPRYWHLSHLGEGVWEHGPSGTSGPLGEMLGAITHVYQPDDPHVVKFDPAGWVMRHPLACRLGDLLECPYSTAAAQQIDRPPAAGLGVYRVDLGDDGKLVIAEQHP